MSIFKLISFTYISSEDGPLSHTLHVEASLFKGSAEPDYKDSRATPRGGAVIITQGMHSGGRIAGFGWKMEESWNRMVVVLVHNYPNDAWEVDDRFYVSFSYK